MSDDLNNQLNELSEDDLENVAGGWAWENNKSRKKDLAKADIKVEKKLFGKDKYYVIDEEGKKVYLSKSEANDFVAFSKLFE